MTRLKLATRQQQTFELALHRQIDSFCQSHPDVEVEIVARPVHGHYAKIIAEPGGGDTCDIMLCCTDWLPEAIEKDLLLPLNPLIGKSPPDGWPDAYHPAMQKLQQKDGQVYGLPWHDGPQVLHYRSDLFDDPLEKAAYRHRFGEELLPPTTWSKFLRVAHFFTRPSENLWGCCEASYTDGHNNVYDFLIHLWSRGGELWDENRVVQFQNEIGQEALRYYRDLFTVEKVASPECLKMGSVEAGDFYASGQAAMMWNWCGFAAVAELPQFSNIVGKNRCAPMPGGDPPFGSSVSLNIYWVMTIMRSSPDAQLAYDFCRFLASPEMDKVTSMSGANGVRLSTWNDPEIRQLYPYYNIIEKVHATTRTLPAVSEYPQINEILSQLIHAVIHEGASPADALLRGAQVVQKIIKL